MNVAEYFDPIGRVWSNGSSTVWKARDRRLDRLVALKSLDAPTAQLRDQWREEARVLAYLSHPNLVGVYGYVESDTDAYIVEEWIDGATLSAVLGAVGRLSPAQALGVIRGALLGLGHVHQQGMVHADVSATNILIDTMGTSKLIDFGLATTVGAAARRPPGPTRRRRSATALQLPPPVTSTRPRPCWPCCCAVTPRRRRAWTGSIRCSRRCWPSR